MSSWQAGATLAERLAAEGLQQARGRTNRSGPRGPAKRWRSERRADIGRVSHPEAIRLDPPLWLQTFQAAYDRAGDQKRPVDTADDLLVAVEPIIANARDRIDEALRGPASSIAPAAKDDRAALVASIELGLRKRLFEAISKTLVLELAVASRRKILVGNSSKDRFFFFCKCLADRDFARALLAQYPVLMRRVATMANNWETSTLTMLSRLSISRQTLTRQFFGGDDPGPLVSAGATGDTHCGGQSVHILHFASGQHLVYKPRPVALENCFFDLIALFNRDGFTPELKYVATCDEGHFGWMEFVDSKPCQTREEIDRFFVRQGAQIALAYVLGGTDLHFENVIAHGEYPVLVDLETLFQTPFHAKDDAGATSSARHALQMSVMGTQLLPEPLFFAADGHWIDLSALGHSDGQLTPLPVPVWNAFGSDRMGLSHERVPMAGGVSLPEYQGMREPASPNVELVVEGFRYAYEFLRKRKAALLSEKGPLAVAKGKPARRIFRGTTFYAQLLDESHHPRFLNNAINLEAFLHDRLRVGLDDRSPSAIEDAEVGDLLSGDIPYFASSVGEAARCPISSEETGFVGNGLEECCARVRALSDADLDRQISLVRVALADLGTPVAASTSVRTAPSNDPTSQQLIATATRIGERLCELAIVDGEHASWLVPVIASQTRLKNSVAGLDLYNGLPGIALFLGHLGAKTGNHRYSNLAVAAMTEALALYKAIDNDQLSLGVYDGIGGLSYVLQRLSEILDRPQWGAEAVAMLERAAKQTSNYSELDAISGKAGFILAVLAVHNSKESSGLIQSLRPTTDALKQVVALSGKRGQCSLPDAADAGLAHGRAGIGFALSRWADLTGDEESRAIAAELIGFDLDAIDTRQSASNASTQISGWKDAHLGWCRGWLGAALMALQARPTARILCSGLDFHFGRIADDIISGGTDGPLCLCHGALGHMDFLTVAQKRGVLGDPGAAVAWRNRLLARLIDGDWVADSSHRLEAPGLMLGLAGTGYSLLRASGSRRMPSVLTL
jgi:type 2 lantibiotic biosynthesis protein LanM